MRRLPTAGAALVAVVALCVPFFAAPYQNAQLTTAWIYATAVLGLNVLTGRAGQISVAQGAFFALGAYTTAILLDRGLGAPLLAVPAGAAVALVAGLGLGLPALRLRGLYLALVTLAVAVVTPVVIKRADGLTGGAAGLSVETLQSPSWSGLADDQYLYLLAFGLAALAYVVARLVTSGRHGRALVALRDEETTAAAVGIRRAPVLLQAFALSAGLAGAAGAFSTLAVGFVSPDSFTLMLGFALVTAMVVGGSRSLLGALYGALFVVYAPTVASDVDTASTGVVYGGALLLCVYLLPGGAVGAAEALGRRIRAQHRPSFADALSKPAEATAERPRR